MMVCSLLPPNQTRFEHQSGVTGTYSQRADRSRGYGQGRRSRARVVVSRYVCSSLLLLAPQYLYRFALLLAAGRLVGARSCDDPGAVHQA